MAGFGAILLPNRGLSSVFVPVFLIEMEIPKLDLSEPETIVKEIFDDDRWVKDEFAKHLSADLLLFAQTLAVSFKTYPDLDALSKDNKQASYVSGFVLGVLDDVLTSTKLLVAGKLMASGNLMRQAIEGVAMALLCSAKENVHVRKKHQTVRISYWRHVDMNSELARSHKALGILEMNCAALGVSRQAVSNLIEHKNHYNKFSHPGMMGMASRVSLGEAGPIFVGGSFDPEKLKAYKIEISSRIGFSKILPGMIDKLRGASR